MDAKKLPARPNLERCKESAKDLLKTYNSGDSDFRARIQRRLSKLSNSDVPKTKLALADAQLLVAHSYGFENWPKLKKHIEALARKHSPVSEFESAVDAVVAGDVATLTRLLKQHPGLIGARSTRMHASTLLHYVSANGVEDYRQKTPKNIAKVTKLLLKAGAEVDAENNPGHGTTLGLAATSVHPAKAGVQIALLETLLDAGASPDGLPGGWNPLTAALANGRGDAAEFLAKRGARLDLEGAAGTGRLDVVKTFFKKDKSLKATATHEQMMSGFAWACECGRTSIVDFLLQNGIEIDARLRHDKQTGLHWAAIHGHADTVRLLLKRKAPVSARDESYNGTPLEWALYGWGDPPPEANLSGYYQVVARLVAAGATVDPKWLTDPDREISLVEKVRADRRMLAALGNAMPR